MAISVKEHLTQLHDRMVQHHTKKAASHSARAAHFSKLAGHFKKTETTEAEKDAQSILAALAAEHEEMSQEHADMASFHEDCQEKCSKAVADGDLNKMQPLPPGLSILAPDRPRAIIRTGQRPIAEATAVEPDIRKMLALDAEDQHTEEMSLQK